MDWATHDHRPPTPATPAPLQSIATYWRLAGGSGRLVTCGLYSAPAGRFEVRVHYGAGDELLRSHVVRSRDDADDLASAWRRVAIEKGFREVL